MVEEAPHDPRLPCLVAGCCLEPFVETGGPQERWPRNHTEIHGRTFVLGTSSFLYGALSVLPGGYLAKGFLRQLLL